jgi:hypothetical protein
MMRHRSLPFWKNEFFRLDDDFRYFSKTRLVDDGFYFFVRDFT